MASKRLLKKQINNLTYQLVSECFTYRHFHPDRNPGINEIINDVVKSRNDLVARINQAPSGKEELKPHFRGIHEDMKTMINHLDKIESLAK